MRNILCCAAVGLALAMVVPPAIAAKHPVPATYPAAWELTFKHGLIKRIVVDVPGTGPKAFWYLTYTVTNPTKEEQNFFPSFTLVGRDGQTYHSDQSIPAAVFPKIKSAEGDTLLEPARKIVGPLHIGEDQAKDGVAIWPEPEARMGSFNVFVGGLSGEYAMLTDDDDKPVMGPDNKQVILHKTLAIDYVVWGDELYPDKDEVHQKGETWVMR